METIALVGTIGSLVSGAVGTAVSYAGQRSAASQAKQIANMQAKEEERIAAAERVKANQEAIRKGKMADQDISRARAVAADSGTADSDRAGLLGLYESRMKSRKAGNQARLAANLGEDYNSRLVSAGVTRAGGQAKASQYKSQATATLIGGIGDAFAAAPGAYKSYRRVYG